MLVMCACVCVCRVSCCDISEQSIEFERLFQKVKKGSLKRLNQSKSNNFVDHVFTSFQHNFQLFKLFYVGAATFYDFYVGMRAAPQDSSHPRAARCLA